MKKRMLSLLMALCLMLTLVPAAFAVDTSGLQDLIDNATSDEITLTQDYTISDTVTIDKELTINGGGYTITYTGSDSAISITSQAAVTLKSLTINATASDAYAIDLTSSAPNLTVNGCTINAHTRGINMYPDGGCTNGSLTVSNTSILNSQVTDYENNTTVGDTRGIALYDVKNSTIKIENGSNIKGFGYSINTSATEEDNGTRPGSNTYTVDSSNIWGWSAFNVWTVGNTFDITNCDLRGINPLNTVGNSFSVIVLNQGIYGSDPDNASPNVFNISGGTLDAKTVQNTIAVEETIAYIGDQFTTEFHFSRYRLKRVAMTCDKLYSAIIAEKDPMTSDDSEFAAWAASNKLTGPENTTYNQGSTSIFFPNRGLIAPGVYAGVTKTNAATLSLDQNSISERHIGGETA